MDDKDLMIEQQLIGRDIYDEKVLDTMRAVDRKIFVPDDLTEMANDDTPLPIGEGQVIGQPYIIAYMVQAMDLQPEDKVLEIGSGCGYNAAVLSCLVAHVYSLETSEVLARRATKNIKRADIPNVTIHYGDGLNGWAEKSPFNKIILNSAPSVIPEALKQQLVTGGKILVPVTSKFEKLMLFEKWGENEFKVHELIPVRFVPLREP